VIDMKAPVDYKINKLDDRSTLIVNVVITRQLKIRAAIFTMLIKLAAWVIGSGVQVTQQEPADD